MKARIVKNNLGIWVVVPASGLAPMLLLECLSRLQAEYMIIHYSFEHRTEEEQPVFYCRIVVPQYFDSAQPAERTVAYINANLPES